MPLPLLAVGQGGLSALTNLFRFGHAKAVAAENSAIGSAQNQVQKELEKIETQAREGQLSDAQIDSKLQALLDGYYSTVSSVIKGRIASEDEFNPGSKKTSSGGPCNAACVIGGQVADLINEARLKLKAVAKEGRGKKGGPSSDVEVVQAGMFGPLPEVLRKMFSCVFCAVVPGALIAFGLYLIWKYRKRRK